VWGGALNLPRMKLRRIARQAGFAALWLAASAPALAASDAEVAELRRALLELQAQNRELARRLTTLEGGTEGGQRRRRPVAPRSVPEAAAPVPVQPEATAAVPVQPVRPTTEAGKMNVPPGESSTGVVERRPSSSSLEQRVRDLEITRAAQESATRSIIRDSLTTLGASINQNIALGGALEARIGRFGDFTGPAQEFTELSTAELDFDIKFTDWVFGSMILGFDPGVSAQAPSFGARPTTGVDRFRLDRGTITIGDVQRFPIYARMGRDTLAFGTSTGIARVDTLSLSGPLSVEAFESRQDAIGIGFALPTPALVALPPPVVIPPVPPLAVNPLVSSMAGMLGYSPPPVRLQPLRPLPLPPVPPAFYGSIYTFNGNRDLAPNRGLRQNLNASLGYRTEGSCGQRFEELRDSLLCPWTADFRVDYISSVYDSNFLAREYAPFLPQIGQIPGMAASLRASFGPFSFTGEYNTAIRTADYIDDTGRRIRAMPAAWQASLAYQFAWNPWVEKIGEQGNYIALTYSGTQDLGGAAELLNGVPNRIGFLPQTRLALTVGEWVLPGLRLAAELSGDWDYSPRQGGTGNAAAAFVTSVLFTF
jgi:uncharacterized coiled-coil protein SlyX